MTLMLALFGASGVGKTTVSKELAKQMGLPVRHCGDAIKAKARERQVHVDALTEDDHRAIDQETRQMVRHATSALIVEGRYLPEVLAEFPNVVLFELTCDKTERLRRRLGRSAEASLESLAAHDAVMTNLRLRLYAGVTSPQRPIVRVNTNGLSPKQVADLVSALFSAC